MIVELFNKSAMWHKLQCEIPISEELKEETLRLEGTDWLSNHSIDLIRTGPRNLIPKKTKPQV